ncbi:MAG: hypothetical protein DHS20C10_04040 [marine bacterium B5-7]|nr:MAG: hypothetical protein DHS20C10_04040 [marine bacterium B5-7]
MNHAVSTHYQFDLTLWLQSDKLSFLQLPAKLKLFSQTIHGIIRRCTKTHLSSECVQYQLILASPLQVLKQDKTTRVFVDCSATTCLAPLLQAQGLSLRWLVPSQKKQQHIQDQENDLDFLQRLTSQENTFFWHQQTPEYAIQVAKNKPLMHSPLHLSLRNDATHDQSENFVWEKISIKTDALHGWHIHSNCPALAPGVWVSIAGEIAWVHTVTHHLNDYNQYVNHTLLISDNCIFQPTYIDNPIRSHFYTAIIDAPKSHPKEIPFLDKQGQYRIQFEADQHKKTAGIRSMATPLMQPYGDKNPKKGMHLPLLAGTRVCVQFIDRDYTQPIIAGTLPEAPPINKDNHTQECWQSHAGSAWWFDDDPEHAGIQLKTAGNKQCLHLSNAPDKTGIHIQASQSLHCYSQHHSHWHSDGDLMLKSDGEIQWSAKQDGFMLSDEGDIHLQAAQGTQWQASNTLCLQADTIHFEQTSFFVEASKSITWKIDDTFEIEANELRFNAARMQCTTEQNFQLRAGGASLCIEPNTIQCSHISLTAATILVPNKEWLGR